MLPLLRLVGDEGEKEKGFPVETTNPLAVAKPQNMFYPYR